MSHTSSKMWNASNQQLTYSVLLPVNPNVILGSLTPNTVKQMTGSINAPWQHWTSRKVEDLGPLSHVSQLRIQVHPSFWPHNRTRPCPYLSLNGLPVLHVLTLILLMWRIGWAPNSIPVYSYIQQDATLHSLFISGNCSVCFGWYFHPSSGAHTTVSTASGICHTVTAICRYRGRVGTGLSVLWVAYADSVCKTRGYNCSFELLMMSGGSLETCWAINKQWNNKF